MSLIKVTKLNEVQDKEVLSEEYISDLYVFTKTPKMDLLFRKDTMKLYQVDDTLECLLEVKEDVEQIRQIEQLKKMFLNIDIKKNKINEKEFQYIIEGKGNSVTLNAEMYTSIYEELKNTASHDSFLLSQKSSLVDINLLPSELIKESFFSMNIQGNIVTTKSTLKTIDLIYNNTSKYDYLLEYSIK